MSDISVQIYNTSDVSQSTVDLAKDAINRLDSQIEADIVADETVFTGDFDLDKNSKDNTTQKVEYELFSTFAWPNYLARGSIHLILYNHTDISDAIGGAGWARWAAGGSGEGSIDRRYSAKGKYALAFVNEATKRFPYNDQWFKNTVIHEIGHCFTADHQMGSLYEMTGLRATPMATWYVEGWLSGNDQINNFCWDTDDDTMTSGHTDNLSFCTESRMDTHFEDHKEDMY